MTFLEWSFYGNPALSWFTALGAAVGLFLVLRLAKAILVRQLTRIAGRTKTSVDDIAVEVLRKTRFWFLAAVALWLASLILVLPGRTQEMVATAAVLITLLQGGIWGGVAIRAYVERFSEQKMATEAPRVTTVRAMGFLGSILVWAVVLLMALDNLGIEVTALVAGLGIGGVAVALAVQNILGDLFASLSIVLDRPFVYGDFIVVGDFMGSVEKIGLKTTRLRSLSGEQLVFSNSDLLSSRIRNYKRMFERRVVFTFGVVYDTPEDELQAIPSAVRDIIESLPDTRFDRAHFHRFGDSSLDFEVVYFVKVPEYNTYMDRQQAIHLEILRRFRERGIQFAFPTRTLIVESLPKLQVGNAEAAQAGEEHHTLS